MPAPSFEGACANHTYPAYAGASSHLFKLIEQTSTYSTNSDLHSVKVNLVSPFSDRLRLDPRIENLAIGQGPWPASRLTVDQSSLT